MMKKILSAFLILSLTFLLVSCSNDAASSDPQISDAVSSEKPQAGASLLRSNVKILDESGQPLASISAGSVTYGTENVRTKVGSSGKLKYIDASGQVIAKIKRSSREKFKLKTNSGDLLWKVKLKASSIKIASNEEMTGAYKIKLKDDTRTKLLLDEQQFGEARLEQGAFTVRGQRGNYQVQTDNASVASVIGLDGVPLEMRLVIMSELLK